MKTLCTRILTTFVILLTMAGDGRSQVPGCVTNISPSSFATVQLNPSVVFTWNSAPNATGYRFILRGLLGDTLLNSIVSGTTHSIAGFQANSFYSWYVVPFSAAGSATACASNATYIATATTVVNDNCSGAIGMTALSGPQYASTIASTQSQAGCTGTATTDIWYKTTALYTGNLQINVGAGSAGGNAVLQVFSGTCAGLTSLACVNATGANSPETYTIAATANTTYYYRVYDFSGTATVFTIEVTGTALANGMDKLEGKVLAGNTAQLNWMTRSEEHNSGFEIQRSADGRNFITVGFAASRAMNGESKEAIAYDFKDKKPLTGIAYYRLQQVFKDGKTVFSNTVRLNIKGENAFEIVAAPNPVKDKLNLKLYGERGNGAQVTILDMNGKVFRKLDINADDTNLDLNDLGAGIYLLRYTDANRSQAFKINKL